MLHMDVVVIGFGRRLVKGPEIKRNRTLPALAHAILANRDLGEARAQDLTAGDALRPRDVTASLPHRAVADNSGLRQEEHVSAGSRCAFGITSRDSSHEF